MGGRKLLGSIGMISQLGQAEASGVVSQKAELSRVHCHSFPGFSAPRLMWLLRDGKSLGTASTCYEQRTLLSCVLLELLPRQLIYRIGGIFPVLVRGAGI